MLYLKKFENYIDVDGSTDNITNDEINIIGKSTELLTKYWLKKSKHYNSIESDIKVEHDLKNTIINETDVIMDIKVFWIGENGKMDEPLLLGEYKLIINREDNTNDIGSSAKWLKPGLFSIIEKSKDGSYISIDLDLHPYNFSYWSSGYNDYLDNVYGNITWYE